MVLTAPLGSTGNPHVNLISGLPISYPFEITVDLGIYSGTNLIQEEMLVTGAPVNNGDGTYTLPVTRGFDGTTAQAHSSNAVVVHTGGAQDYTDARVHIDSSAGVHGLAGNVVGDTDTQTLSNKTLTGALVTADPTASMGVADKQYVDSGDSTNATAISNEVTRATGAETALTTALNALLSGSWVSVTPASGWTNHSPYAPFRVLKAGNLVLVQGMIGNTGSVANGATVGTLASGYYNPTYSQFVQAFHFQTNDTAATTAGGGLYVSINTSGVATIQGITAAGTMNIGFSGFIYLT
jgi:hypothetical protein